MFSPSKEERRKRRRKSTSQSASVSRHRRPEHTDQDGADQPDTEHPVTVEQLRQARLSHIEAQSTWRRSNTGFESGRASSVRTRNTATDTARSTARSTRDQAESGSKRKKRRRKSSKPRSGIRTKESDDEDDQYVYHSSARPAREEAPTVVAQDERQDDRQDDSGEDVAPPQIPRDSTSSVPRRTSVRRHTSSPVRRELAPTSKYSTPSLIPGFPFLRSTSTASEVSRPTIRRSHTTSRAKSEIAAAAPYTPPIPLSPTTTTVPRETRKSPSIINGLFSSKPRIAPQLHEKKVSCLTCGDDVARTRTAKLPCAHRMCHPCLKRIFKMSITDPAHMPPRCCTEQAIDLKHVDSLFDYAFKKTWNRKFKEYKAKNRTYCPRKGCGEWIQPKHMTTDKGRKIGRCPSCKTHVCGICSQKMHKSRDCPQDPALHEFAEVAEKSGWRKCYSCSAMVELKEGCNHMTCRCTAEFCMVCGLKWKSCDCPWFSYAAVDVNGDPVRYQQELDRRREQEHRDEELARRMEALDVQVNGNPGLFAADNVGHPSNDNFIQQAREALTANYRVADQAARGLLNGFLNGRELRVAELLTQVTNDQPPNRRPVRRRQHTDHDPAEGRFDASPMGIPAGLHVLPRDHTPLDPFANRPQTDAERLQEQRMRAWADGVHSE